MSNKNLIVLILFAVCLVFALVVGITMSLEKETRTFGFSELITSFAVFFSIVGIVRQLISLHNTRRDSLEKTEEEKREGSLNIYLVIGLVLGYILLSRPLGFVLSSVILLLVYLWAAGFKRRFVGIVYSCIVPILMYFLFKNLFGINLPQGPLFF